MTTWVKISEVSEGSASRAGGRAAACRFPAAQEIDLHLDREPSLSFLDGLIRELREKNRLGHVTLIAPTALVLRHLGRFVAHDPTLEIWVRTPQGVRARVELPEEDPIEIEEGPIGDDVGLA